MININRQYNKMFIMTLVVINLYVYLTKDNFSFLKPVVFVSIFGMFIYSFCINLNRLEFNWYKLSIVSSIILCIIIGVVYHVINLVGVGVISLLALNLNKKSLVKNFFYAIAISFGIISIMSVVNIIPNSNLLGFTINNTTGFFIGCTAMVSVFKFQKKICSLFITLAIIINWVVFDDRTMAIILALFLVLYNTKILYGVNHNKLLKYNIVLLPFWLTVFSFMLAKLLNNFEFIHVIDNVLSYRISIWNNIITTMHINFFPQTVVSNFYISSFEINQPIFSWIKIQGLDGFFIISFFQYGIILATIFLISMSLMLEELFDNTIQNFIILCFSICWIALGFSETIIGSYNLSFLIPLAFNVIYNKNKLLVK